jgi:hypothetical protein
VAKSNSDPLRARLERLIEDWRRREARGSTAYFDRCADELERALRRAGGAVSDDITTDDATFKTLADALAGYL